ncbi:6285_t:CDS:2, partial [Racocetra fulgida]
KTPDGRAKIVRIELGNVREKYDEKRKYTYHCKYEFHDEVSCCDEHLNRVYESGMKIERNEKGKVDIMNRVDELGDNEVKEKEVKVKNDVEEVVINRVGNDYANDKVKTKIAQRKEKSEGKVNTYLESELEEYSIVEESC